MNYELAKKLKDAGFPQGSKYENDEGTYDEKTGVSKWENGEFVYYPTLSELIEACGDRFESLIKDSQTSYWYANSTGKEHTGIGNSPEEAVAHLLLELKNKYMEKIRIENNKIYKDDKLDREYWVISNVDYFGLSLSSEKLKELYLGLKEIFNER